MSKRNKKPVKSGSEIKTSGREKRRSEWKGAAILRHKENCENKKSKNAGWK
jgi:hypothetical protein